MKRFVILFFAILSTFCLHSAEVDFSLLEEAAQHPRLLVSPGGMAVMKMRYTRPLSPEYAYLCKKQIERADAFVADSKILEKEMDVAGKRMLKVSRDALSRIFSCAWAWNMTSDRKYLDYTVSLLRQVCAFDNWNPSHFLDVAEMALAVSVGYDWTYDYLDPQLRAQIREKLTEYCLVPSMDSTYNASWVSKTINWNPVCHCGCLAAAICTWEDNPELSKQVILRAIEKNPISVEASYSPDGLYPEGAGYWSYGTDYQIAFNSILTRVFGSAFGIDEIPGFSQTCRAFLFLQGNTGKYYDYSDTPNSGAWCEEGWYFASRFGDPSALSLVVRGIREGKVNCTHRMSPLFLIYASLYDGAPVPEPSGRVFLGKGRNPVAVARTGWNRNDLYLGIKGGCGNVNHGHLDVGSFIFEAGGCRWINEMHIGGGYGVLERLLKQAGLSGLFNMKKDSPRWDIFTYGNREHSTLTVNDKKHNPAGKGEFLELIDAPGRIGASIDITDVFGGEVVKAVRTLVIVDDSYLEITDEITAPQKKAVSVRFNLVTRASVSVNDNSGGLTLSRKDSFLLVDAKGAKVNWCTWSAKPADYPGPVNSNITTFKKGPHLCGYTYKVPSGKTVRVVTTLRGVE